MNDALALQDNPFRNAPVVAQPAANEAMVAVTSQREIAEVQAAMVLARRFPRVEVEVMDKILQACTRPTLAEGALYEFARGGSDIRGPSIRLAECVAQYWGHIDFGWRVLEERPGATKVQAFAWDMQTGVRSQMVFDVTHERVAHGSKKQLHDPRDIYEHCANAASRRLRACILRVIPGDVIEAAQKQCEATLRAKVEVTPELVADMVGKFAELGVTKAQIEKRIQRRLDAITPGLATQLRKIYTSLRDEMSLPGDWFDVGTTQAPGDATGGVQAVQGEAQGSGGMPSPRQAVRDRIQARKQARVPGEAQADASSPPVAQASQALQDIVRFARAAVTQEDVGRVRQIALQLTDEDEVLLAQQHITAAATRIG